MKQSPLSAFEDEKSGFEGKAGVMVTEVPFQGYYNLRCNPDDIDTCESVRLSCGLDLPADLNRFVCSESLSIYCLGPDEWLLKIPDEQNLSVIDAIRLALGNSFYALTDISSGMTNIRISGEHVDMVVCQATSLDIHQCNFPVDSCAQTLFAKTNVIIARCSESVLDYDLLVRRSFADYLMLFLTDAAADYGYELAVFSSK